MTRKKMVEVQCDRCQRVEYVDEDSLQAVQFVASLATVGGETPKKEVSYFDLCKPCQKTISKHLDAIDKEFRGKSPDRTKDQAKKKASPP